MPPTDPARSDRIAGTAGSYKRSVRPDRIAGIAGSSIGPVRSVVGGSCAPDRSDRIGSPAQPAPTTDRTIFSRRGLDPQPGRPHRIAGIAGSSIGPVQSDPSQAGTLDRPDGRGVDQLRPGASCRTHRYEPSASPPRPAPWEHPSRGRPREVDRRGDRSSAGSPGLSRGSIRVLVLQGLPQGLRARSLARVGLPGPSLRVERRPRRYQRLEAQLLALLLDHRERGRHREAAIGRPVVRSRWTRARHPSGSSC